MFVDDALDLVDELRAVFNQVLPEVGELPDLGIGRISRKNSSDAIGTLSALEPFTDIFADDLETIESESTIEINFALLKVKHTIKRGQKRKTTK